MDERLQKALEASNYRLNLLNLKENLRIKFDTMITVAYNGGLFKSTRELISFVNYILSSGKNTAVLIDENGNPCEIADLNSFLDQLVESYFTATNFYHVEYTKLKTARSTAEQFSEILAEQ